MANVSKKIWLNYKEAAEIIIADVMLGANLTYSVEGPPGGGKTSMVKYIAERLNRPWIYMDIPTLEISDLGIPMPNHQTKTTNFYFNEAWGLHLAEDTPYVIVYDEFTKGQKAVKDTLHPSLTKLGGQRRLGSLKLHPDTCLFTTGNLMTDMVGDKKQAHTRGRLNVINYKYPPVKDWREWAVEAGIHPVVTYFAMNIGDNVFANYMIDGFNDLPEDIRWMVFNPDIKNPYKDEGYVCPRTLAFASDVVKGYEDALSRGVEYTDVMFQAALQGAIGYIGATKLMVDYKFASKKPSPKSILADPMNAPVPSPTDIPVQILTVYDAHQWCCREGFGLPKPTTRLEVVTRVEAWMDYMSRLDNNVQHVFIDMLRDAGKNASKEGIVTDMSKLWGVLTTTKKFISWVQANEYKY
jgi:AAA domain (dynein-related subfamily)